MVVVRVVDFPPQPNVVGQLTAVGDLLHLTRFFHAAIPRQLSLCDRPRDGRTMPTRKRIAEFDKAADLRSDAEANPTSPQLTQREDAFAAIQLVRHPDLSPPHFVQWPRQVAVPLHGVH